MTPESHLVLITEHNAQAISFQRHLGEFFRQDCLDRLVLGIRKVRQGEHWIPHHLLCEKTGWG